MNSWSLIFSMEFVNSNQGWEFVFLGEVLVFLWAKEQNSHSIVEKSESLPSLFGAMNEEWREFTRFWRSKELFTIESLTALFFKDRWDWFTCIALLRRATRGICSQSTFKESYFEWWKSQEWKSEFPTLIQTMCLHCLAFLNYDVTVIGLNHHHYKWF